MQYKIWFTNIFSSNHQYQYLFWENQFLKVFEDLEEKIVPKGVKILEI